jgi:phage baseplate assembly protein gpV
MTLAERRSGKVRDFVQPQLEQGEQVNAIVT